MVPGATDERTSRKPAGCHACRPAPGHLLLLQAFRLHLSRQAGRVGLLYALADRHLGKAIGALHADPARRWTLAELAMEAWLSRSIFAQRLRNQMGETPIGYLTTWRMTLARDSLADAREPLARIANTLGYESENAFSTAFRRVVGCSPRRYAPDVRSATVGRPR